MTDETKLNDAPFGATKSSNDYFKLEDGDNVKIRMLTTPVLGYVKYDNEAKKFYRSDKQVDEDYRLTAVVAIRNYNLKLLQTWEIGQARIRKALNALWTDPDFGSCLEYDMKVSRTGKSMQDTTYSIQALAKTAFAEKVEEIPDFKDYFNKEVPAEKMEDNLPF